MTTDPAPRVREVISEFLKLAEKPVHGELTGDLLLYADGLGLDSLETAELSAHLEDEFGEDPFSAALAAGEDMPQTVGAIVEFYGVASSS